MEQQGKCPLVAQWMSYWRCAGERLVLGGGWANLQQLSISMVEISTQWQSHAVSVFLAPCTLGSPLPSTLASQPTLQNEEIESYKKTIKQTNKKKYESLKCIPPSSALGDALVFLTKSLVFESVFSSP